MQVLLPSLRICCGDNLAREIIFEHVSHITAWWKWCAWTIPPHSSLFNFSPPLNPLLQTRHLKQDSWNLYEPASLIRKFPNGFEHRWHLDNLDQSRMYWRSDGINLLIKNLYSLPLIFIPTSSPSTSNNSPDCVLPSTVVQVLASAQTKEIKRVRLRMYRILPTICKV